MAGTYGGGTYGDGTYGAGGGAAVVDVGSQGIGSGEAFGRPTVGLVVVPDPSGAIITGVQTDDGSPTVVETDEARVFEAVTSDSAVNLILVSDSTPL